MNHTMRLALALAIMLLVTCTGIGCCAPVTGVGLSDVLAALSNDTPNLPFWCPSQPGLTGSSIDASSGFNARIAEQYGKLPLSFVENRGQLNSAVRYVIRGPLASAFFTDNGVTFDLSEPLPKDSDKELSTHDPLFRDFGHAQAGNLNPSSIRSGRPGIMHDPNPETTPRKCAALRMEFEGADPNCRVEGIDELPGKVNYFTGGDSAKWHTDIPTFKGVIYRGVWPGVDVSYHGDRRQLKYDIRVAPGADLSQIRLRYEGAENLWLDDSGDLHVQTAVTAFVEKVPGIYQENGAAKQALVGGYVLLDDHTVGFGVEGRNPDLPLVIDPASDLVYSTFLGGSSDDRGSSIAVDSSGCAYVVGITWSFDFPTTAGAFHRTFGGYYDAFVTKLNATGSALVYSTFLGGSSSDQGISIAVDSSGCAYVAGFTDSTDFPVTGGALQMASGGAGDGFVAKLNANGTELVYSTYLGGSGYEYGLWLSLDSAGCAYVAGPTQSPNFPTTPGAYCTDYSGPSMQFIVKLNSAGTAFAFSTMFGHGASINGMALDSSGCVYIAGSAHSPDFPTTPGAYDRTYTGCWTWYDVHSCDEGFVTKLNASATVLVYSTFLGDDGYSRYCAGIAVDHTGCAYVSYSLAMSENYRYNYMTKLSPRGNAIVYSTRVVPEGGGIVGLDEHLCAYSVGNWYGFHGGSDELDVYISKVNPDGTTDGCTTTKIGGSGYDYLGGIAVDPAGNVYITGFTGSQNYPTTASSFDTSFTPPMEAFVTKLATSTPVPPGTPGWDLPAGTTLSIRNPYAGYAVQKRVKGQLHSHYYQDGNGWGSITPEALIRDYHDQLGYDFVCVTEHYHCTTDPGLSEPIFMRYAEEVTKDFAHVLALGITHTGCSENSSGPGGDEARYHPWDSTATTNGLCEIEGFPSDNLQQVTDQITQWGGLAILAHPNGPAAPDPETLAGVSGLTAVSVYTAANNWPIMGGAYHTPYASGKWDWLLSMGKQTQTPGGPMLIFCATEDDFTPRICYGAFGRTWIVADVTTTSPAQGDIMDAVKRGRYWAYWAKARHVGTGPLLTLSVSQPSGMPVISVTSDTSLDEIKFYGATNPPSEGPLPGGTGSGMSASYTCNGTEKYVRVEARKGDIHIYSQAVAIDWQSGAGMSAPKAVGMRVPLVGGTPADIMYTPAQPAALPAKMPPMGYIGRAYNVSTTSGTYPPDATLTLSYEGIAPTPYGTSNLAVYRWDAPTAAWMKLTSTVDIGAALVTAPLAQQGLYAISAQVTGDATAPTVTIHMPTDGATLTGEDVIGVQASDNVGVLRTSFYLNDQCIGTDSIGWDGYTCEYDFGKKSAGPYTLKVVAEDVSGNRGSAQVTVNIVSSGVAPVLTMTNPANGANLTGTVTVSGICADDTLVTGVFVIADGIPVGEASITGGNWTFDLDTSQLADGPHSLSAMVMDEDQNTYEQGISVNISGTVLPRLSDAKSLDDGQQARFGGRVVTFGNPGDDGAFYVEELNRLSGIRVQGKLVPAEGDMVTASGVMTTVDGERALVGADVLVRSSSNPVPGALGIRGGWLGGGALGLQPGITGAFGLNNIGLLVRTSGKVTQIGDGYLYIDDGSRLKDGTLTGTDENIGVRVICDPSGRWSGEYLIATGISSCFQTPAGNLAPRVLKI